MLFEHRSSDVWRLHSNIGPWSYSYAPMFDYSDVWMPIGSWWSPCNSFQVAEAPTNWYVYTPGSRVTRRAWGWRPSHDRNGGVGKKLYNGYIENDDWLDMNVQKNFNTRNNKVCINNTFNLRNGLNILTKRPKILNNLIDYN